MKFSHYKNQIKKFIFRIFHPGKAIRLNKFVLINDGNRKMRGV